MAQKCRVDAREGEGENAEVLTSFCDVHGCEAS